MTDDTRLNSHGKDTADGGEGDDNLDGDHGIDYIFGGSGDDTITGGSSTDFLMGGSGNDTIDGGWGSDYIRGGSGDDTIEGADGDDIILGDAGDDTIDAGSGYDTIIDGEGDDTLTGGSGEDTFAFLPGHGDDTITDFDTSRDEIDLSQFTTAITFTQLQGKMSTVTDPDDPNTVTGVQIDLTGFGGGTITLEGVTSTSTLTAEMFCLPDCDSTVDDIFTTEDPITGNENGNLYLGNTVGVTYNTLGGEDIVLAGEGDDTIYGGGDSDWLVGGEGDDAIYGGAGDDTIDGGEGDDTIYGGAGDDTITGGAGDDCQLNGGSGADTFVFGTGDGKDTIKDFENGTDTIDLSAISSIKGFSDLAITQVDDLTKIDLTEWGGGEIYLEGFTSTDLDATDFDFSM